nr:hypothetical protein [Tanacetum cinerariifolium]
MKRSLQDQVNDLELYEETVIDEDDVISKDETLDLITELQNLNKYVLTMFDRARMKAILNDMLSNQFKNAEEYAYHLEQATNFIKESDSLGKQTRGYKTSSTKTSHIIWSTKESNEPPRLVLSLTKQKVNYRETMLMNSLITFIKSHVIWERFHDFQLGIESYQVKVNLTAPTLIFPGIGEYKPYLIVDKSNTGLIYLNIKDEKRIMYLVKIMKFFDATLEKVLKEVKLKSIQSKPWKKSPMLGELDHDIMRAFEREITKHLSHREQMRRWESFVNRRPILPTLKRL